MTENRLNIGLIVPSNNRAGPQKLAAICASDLVRQGHRVCLFIPRLPYFYYFVAPGRNVLSLLRWVRLVVRYVAAYFKDSTFTFEDLLQHALASPNFRIINILRKPFKRQVVSLDYIVVTTIAQVVELQGFYPQEKTIYYLHHLEEVTHGQEQKCRDIRSNFKGPIVALSSWTARQVVDQVPKPPVVPAAISPAFWSKADGSKSVERDKDILFHYSAAHMKGGDIGVNLIKVVRMLRSKTSITVWSRDDVPDLPATNFVKNVSESELCDLYLSHKMMLYPSTMEGFGMPPIEGMACGCIPIVHAGVGGAELYARDGENAILIGQEVEQTARKIADLLEEEDQLDSFRRAAVNSLEPFNPNGYGVRLLKTAGVISG